MTPDERYIYEERLALLGAIGRDATPSEETEALGDVERFRNETNPDQQKKFKI